MSNTVDSTYIPRFRMGSDCTVGIIESGSTGAGVANAEGDGAPAGNPADVNGDGVVNGADLAYVLGQWD